MEFGRRATGLTVALALELLLLLALVSLSQSSDPPLKPQLTEVDLTAQEYVEPAADQPEPAPEPASESQPAPLPAEVPTLAPAPAPPARIPIPTAPPAPEPKPEEAPRPLRPGVVIRDAQGPPDTGSRPTGDSERVGTAPNGEPLYAARWYREPGDEIDGYLATASPGWGLIACRTVPNYFVTDCVPLGETQGSMLNRAMLAASGQFRVRPPRLGGKVLVGAWVRIRIDYTVRRE